MMASLHARALPLLKRLPKAPLNPVLVFGINRVLADALANGQLDFLSGKCCCVQVTDLAWTFTLGKNGSALSNSPQAADVIIAADAQSFVQLMARQIDPDTLFFQRRLLITGDTELGLQIKNFLDQFEYSESLKPLEWCITKMAKRWH